MTIVNAPSKPLFSKLNTSFSWIAGFVSVHALASDDETKDEAKDKIDRDSLNEILSHPQLEIDGHRPGFFEDVLAVSSDFFINEEANKITLHALFFKDMPQFTRVVKFSLQKNKASWKKRGKQFPVIAVYRDGKQVLPEAAAINAISQHTRNSSTLETGHPIGEDITLYPDRGGIGILCHHERAKSQIYRIMLCQALAMAYVDVLKTFADNSSSLIKAVNANAYLEILNTYESFLRFFAGSYRTSPVQRDRHVLFEVWKVVAEHHQIDAIRTEVEAQLRRLGEFIHAENLKKQLEVQNSLLEAEALRAEADRKEYARAEEARMRDKLYQARSERRQKMLNATVAVLSIIIAAVSIPEEMRTYLLDKGDVAWGAAVEMSASVLEGEEEDEIFLPPPRPE